MFIVLIIGMIKKELKWLCANIWIHLMKGLDGFTVIFLRIILRRWEKSVESLVLMNKHLYVITNNLKG